jgi:hypothetical protein
MGQMSLWEDLQKHEGIITLFDSPMMPVIRNGQMIISFHKGYKNKNMKEMYELAKHLDKMIGKGIVSVALNKIVVDISNQKAAYVIADCFINSILSKSKTK